MGGCIDLALAIGSEHVFWRRLYVTILVDIFQRHDNTSSPAPHL